MSARAKFAIDDEVRDVLARSTMTETTVVLPEQLDRMTYVKVNKVLVGAGGKWDRSAKAHLFDRDPRTLLTVAATTGEAVNLKTQLQAFYTPASVAKKLVLLADPKSGERVLEPSAGTGALVAEVLAYQPQCVVTAIDIDEVAIERLQVFKYVTVLKADFLAVRPKDLLEPASDLVVMNPPFSGNQDIRHVTHALSFLKKGGRLLAIVGAGSLSGGNKEKERFLALIDLYDFDIYDLPEGSFKESGTSVNTKILEILT